MADSPRISVVMPIRNEADHLERALTAIDRQTMPRGEIEILIVDGGSTDDTLGIVQRRMATDSRVRLLGGPGVNTPLAMELGREAARSDVIAKVDGHGWVNERFLEVAFAGLSGDGGVGCVGGRIRPVADSVEQQAIAIARFSRFGVGGGVYTLGNAATDTDTVQCGVYRRDALEQAGGFDPAMAYGEDEELNHRIRLHGWRIVYDPAMEFAYRVRPSIAALFRQYLRYGQARVAVVRRHPRFFRVKHAVPALLVLALVLSLVALAVPGWAWVTVLVWGSYIGLLVLAATLLAVRARCRRPDLIAASLAALHLGYGIGTLRGLARRA